MIISINRHQSHSRLLFIFGGVGGISSKAEYRPSTHNMNMNVLSRRILHKCAILHGICSFPENLYLRSYSSTTRQEFGRQFEEIVAQCLRKFSFDVTVCGGPKDRGIDFRGVWLLKSSPVRVIGQCKRYKKRLGPKHVRELEGTLAHEVKGTLGIIVTERGLVCLISSVKIYN